MRTVSRKYRAKQKLARKRLSKKRFGGNINILVHETELIEALERPLVDNFKTYIGKIISLEHLDAWFDNFREYDKLADSYSNLTVEEFDTYILDVINYINTIIYDSFANDTGVIYNLNLVIYNKLVELMPPYSHDNFHENTSQIYAILNKASSKLLETFESILKEMLDERINQLRSSLYPDRKESVVSQRIQFFESKSKL